MLKKILAILLITCLFFALISLGFWQLDRAEEKRQIKAKILSAQQQEPELFIDGNLADKEYYLVRLNGNYDNELQFIYDNQIHNHQAGYAVITPFYIKNSNKTILVNRGFIVNGNNRNKIADITLNGSPTQIVVEIIKPKIRPTLANIATKGQQYITIQSLDIKNIAKNHKLDLYPVLGLLQANQKDGFIRQWQPFYGSVDKHMAYAIQWFLMAIVLIIISFYWFIKKK